MRDIAKNEMLFILGIFKNPATEYNASSIARAMGISPMGALKIARRIEKEGIIVSRQLGRARFYQLALENDYVREYIKFLLKREAEQASSYVKVWLREISKIKNADFALLFGSVLNKQKEAKDVDVLLAAEQKRFQKLKKEVEKINFVNIKKLHPIYQSKEDIKSNIKKQDKIILNAIKGIVAFGEDTFIDVMKR
ncbi:MAG: winged helix-turn-helix domain-containing protein [Candidatus Woesearchaeota archaeon]|nr:winged helix-turn-helix domain-containing protein [Candidatus Woesearchaeota archaeon]